jgi:hypothetical protein
MTSVKVPPRSIQKSQACVISASLVRVSRRQCVVSPSSAPP